MWENSQPGYPRSRSHKTRSWLFRRAIPLHINRPLELSRQELNFVLGQSTCCSKSFLKRTLMFCLPSNRPQAHVGYTLAKLYAPYVTHLCMIVDLMPDSSQHGKCICNFLECCDNQACSHNCYHCFDIHQHLKCYKLFFVYNIFFNLIYRSFNSAIIEGQTSRYKKSRKILFYPPN